MPQNVVVLPAQAFLHSTMLMEGRGTFSNMPRQLAIESLYLTAKVYASSIANLNLEEADWFQGVRGSAGVAGQKLAWQPLQAFPLRLQRNSLSMFCLQSSHHDCSACRLASLLLWVGQSQCSALRYFLWLPGLLGRSQPVRLPRL